MPSTPQRLRFYSTIAMIIIIIVTFIYSVVPKFIAHIAVHKVLENS